MLARQSLTEGPIPQTLLTFALPIWLGHVLQSVNGSVNAIWVGKYLGEAAFAAVGDSNVVMFLLFGVMFGFSWRPPCSLPSVLAPRIRRKRNEWSALARFSFWDCHSPWDLSDRWHAEAIWWSFPLASLTSVSMARGYYRFGGWRNSRMTVAKPARTQAACG